MAAQFNQSLQTSAEVSLEEVRHAMERVLQSRHFIHAPKKQKFIRLVCEFYLNSRAGELNEYLIGREVFDRDDSYNPQADPIVRVGAHDVRKKLELYYQNEGAGDMVRLVVPVGSYEPVFVRQRSQEKTEADSAGAVMVEAEEKIQKQIAADTEVAPSQSGATGMWRLMLASAAALLVIALLSLIVANHGLRQRLEAASRKQSKDRNLYGAVWEPFLKGDKPTLLILSNPTVHRPANEADPEALTRKGINLTSEQASVLTSAAGNRLPVKPDKPMQLVPAFNMYTGIGEAVGAYRLSNLLHAAGEETTLKQSRNISPDDLKDHDVILLGSVYSNQWSKPLSIRENFVYSSHCTIENLEPRPGEEREYKSAFDPRTGGLIEDYALITVTPGVSGENVVMILAGIYSEGTEAAADFVTTSNHLNELNQRLKQLGGKAGTPPYYQALLRVRVENSFPTKISLVTIRELPVTGQ